MSDIRIEHVSLAEEGFWFFDVSKFRDQHGPGKASRSEPVEGFEFSDGQMFCEETACLYIESSGHLIVQYNHHGARAGVIQDYLNTYMDGLRFQFEFRPMYDESTQAKFSNRAATKKVTFKLDTRLLTDEDYNSGTALTQAAQIGRQSDGETIELTITASKNKGGFLSDFVDQTLNRLISKREQDNDSVSKLKVGVLQSLDGRVEVLDLIAERLTHTFKNMPKGADLRFPRNSRYDALRRAYYGWRGQLER